MWKIAPWKIALLFVVLAVGIGSYLFVQRAPSEEESEAVVPGIHFQGARLVGRHDGRRQWQAAADSMFEDDGTVLLRDITELVFFSEEGSDVMATSTEGLWKRSSNDFELIDNVVIQDDEGLYLTTDHLIWRASSEVFESKGPVHILFDRAEISAETMVFDVNSREVLLSGDVVIQDEGHVWYASRTVYMLDSEVLEIIGGAFAEFQLGESGRQEL